MLLSFKTDFDIRRCVRFEWDFFDDEVLHCFRKERVLTPSKMEATANRVEGETSLSLLRMLLIKFSAVSFNPGITSENLSVLAVHSTMTLSTPLDFLNSRMSSRILVIISCLLPVRTLSALSAWFAAMNSGM